MFTTRVEEINFWLKKRVSVKNLDTIFSQMKPLKSFWNVLRVSVKFYTTHSFYWFVYKKTAIMQWRKGRDGQSDGFLAPLASQNAKCFSWDHQSVSITQKQQIYGTTYEESPNTKHFGLRLARTFDRLKRVESAHAPRKGELLSHRLERVYSYFITFPRILKLKSEKASSILLRSTQYGILNTVDMFSYKRFSYRT